MALAREKDTWYGKKSRNWAIRSQAPKAVMVGYGEGSETRWESGLKEDLASLRVLKV